MTEPLSVEERADLDEASRRGDISKVGKARLDEDTKRRSADFEMSDGFDHLLKADGTFASFTDHIGVPDIQAKINKDPNIMVGQFVQHSPTDTLVDRLPNFSFSNVMDTAGTFAVTGLQSVIEKIAGAVHGLVERHDDAPTPGGIPPKTRNKAQGID